MRELDTYLSESLVARSSSHISAEDTGAMVEDTIGKWLQGSNFKTAGPDRSCQGMASHDNR